MTDPDIIVNLGPFNKNPLPSSALRLVAGRKLVDTLRKSAENAAFGDQNQEETQKRVMEAIHKMALEIQKKSVKSGMPIITAAQGRMMIEQVPVFAEAPAADDGSVQAGEGAGPLVQVGTEERTVVRDAEDTITVKVQPVIPAEQIKLSFDIVQIADRIESITFNNPPTMMSQP